MNWLLREKSDGRRTAGYLVYLLAGLAATAALIFLHRSTGSGGPPARQPRPRVSNVAPITQPAAIMSQVDVAAKPAAPDIQSYRMAKNFEIRNPKSEISQTPALPSESFNAIDETLASAPASDSGAAAPEFAELPPAFSEADAASPPPSVRGTRRDAASTLIPGSTSSLLSYRDPTADAAVVDASGAAAGAAAFSPEYFAPRGTLICAYLLTTVDTSNPAAVIQFAAARSLFFNHRCQLPFGTRFLGRLSGAPMRDRLNLAVDTVLYPDGLELPVSASAVEADEAGRNIRPGVAASYFPPPLWVQVAPYFSDFFTGAMGLLESRAQQPFTVGVGGVSVQTTGNGGDLRAPLYQASGQAIQDFTAARLKEVERRYASYYLVPAGTACWLQLDADLNLAAAHVEHRVIHLHEN